MILKKDLDAAMERLHEAEEAIHRLMQRATPEEKGTTEFVVKYLLEMEAFRSADSALDDLFREHLEERVSALEKGLSALLSSSGRDHG